MNAQELPAYGLWPLARIDGSVSILIAFGISKPRTARDWRSFSAVCGFLVALATALRDFGLTIYPPNGWFVRTMYFQLTGPEERQALAAFGETCTRDATATPAFVPRWLQTFAGVAQ